MNVLLVALLSLGPQAPARTQAPSPATAPQVPATAPHPAPGAVPAPAEPESEPAAPQVEAYRGTLAEGLAEIEADAQAKQIDSALAVADALLAPNDFLRWRARVREQGGWKAKAFDAVDPVLDTFGVQPLPPAHRAAVEYARGVVLAGAGRAPEAERSFEAARADAGPGSLRLDAVYNLGTLALEVGEAERAKIPEIQARAGGAPAAQPAPAAPNAPGVPGAPGAPGAPGGAASAPGEPADDPLANARAAYLRARDQLVERVRTDWRDADTRANLELVQRRLHELDELEKEREQKKQEDEQQKQDEPKDQKPKDQQDGQDSKDKQDQKDEKQPEDQKPKDPSDSQGQEPPKPEDEEKPPEEPKPEEQEAKKPEPEDMKEQPLSKEQMMQLLDRLKELEEQARKLQEQMQRARRVKVKKDW